MERSECGPIGSAGSLPCFTTTLFSRPWRARRTPIYRAPRLRSESAALAEDSFSRLECADAAIASHRVFARLNESGDLPSRVRFQVSLPTPLAPVSSFVALTDRAVVETVYESVMISELTEIIEAIPRNELAIQWDVAVEFSIPEGIMTSHLEDAEARVV